MRRIAMPPAAVAAPAVAATLSPLPPSPLPLPPEAKALPIDDETTLLPYDAKADHLAGELDEMYREALQSLRIVVLPKKKRAKPHRAHRPSGRAR